MIYTKNLFVTVDILSSEECCLATLIIKIHYWRSGNDRRLSVTDRKVRARSGGDLAGWYLVNICDWE